MLRKFKINDYTKIYILIILLLQYTQFCVYPIYSYFFLPHIYIYIHTHAHTFLLRESIDKINIQFYSKKYI